MCSSLTRWRSRGELKVVVEAAASAAGGGSCAVASIADHGELPETRWADLHTLQPTSFDQWLLFGCENLKSRLLTSLKQTKYDDSLGTVDRGVLVGVCS